LPSINSCNAASLVSPLCAITRRGAANSIPVAVTNPATAPPTVILKKLLREEPGFDAVERGAQSKEGSEADALSSS
jgi:hypothetical protein